MNTRRYVICDIEATGLDEDKELIEIALITYQDGKVSEVYDTLINPLRPVSGFIQQLTSISGRQLEVAPKFYEVAEAIKLRLEGAVFVSHNTDFDYLLLQKKYQQMGQELKLKTFCTLKTSQQVIPGLRNYNLDALCSFFDIKIKDRHTAIGDARATLELFRELENLTIKHRPRIMYLPQHQKLLGNIPARAGLLTVRDGEGRVLRLEACANMQELATELLQVKPANRELLEKTESLEAEVTGSALIAEFKKLILRPYQAHWMITVEEEKNTEKRLHLRRFRKSQTGIEYFLNFHQARQKIRSLEKLLKGDTFAYRDCELSKEEIVKKNRQLEALIKEASFPHDHLVLLGEGRGLGEKSLVLVRDGHVKGYGLTEASDEEIYAAPEKYLTHRYSRHLGVDLAAKKYLRILKNMRQKTEGWRGLAERI